MSFMTISDGLSRQSGSAGEGMNGWTAGSLAPWTHATQWWMAWWAAWVPASVQPIRVALRAGVAPVPATSPLATAPEAAAALALRPVAPSAAAASARTVLSAVPTTPDDLTCLEGIGPKIAEKLQAAGIQRFHTLAQTPVARLQEILAAAGARIKLAVPDTWPEQAALLAAGDEAGFAALTATLTGGRR